jgi:hypothetical protein
MNTFAKRLQTRASRKGIKVSMQQVREVYQTVVKDLENPSEEEMDLVLVKLEAPATEEGELVAASHLDTLEITEESHPDIWEVLQPSEDAIASDHTELESENLPTVAPTSSEIEPLVEPTHLEPDEPEAALTKINGFTLPDIDKRSLIHQQASALNVELSTSELTTIAGHIADNYASFEDAVQRIKSIILMVLDQRFERASDVLDDTLLTIINRASGNFQSLNGRASQGFSLIAQELKRVDSDFKSKSSKLETSLRQYLLNS